jgi:hypothetical protein
MLAEMDSGQIAEWQAFFKIEADEYQRAELAARAEAGVKNHRRGGR